jgi:glycosyltransferase involved in cell wall biosynthesis
MRVGLLSYPMLFQREGGLQVQLRATHEALRQLGERDLQVALVDLNRERLADYDVLHVFSAINGNYRIVELAADLGIPVVLSALVSPAWSKSGGACARLADRLTGRLTGWNVHTSYAQTKRALQMASMVIALGAAERTAIIEAFRTDPDKIRVLPNGVDRRFFQATAGPFLRRTGIGGSFVLMAGAISPYKNQLALARALEHLGVAVVLAGRAQPQHHDYLQQLLRLPHVHSLGQLAHDDPLLASAYAAARVLALPSQGEVFPLVVLEALAAGTPAVMTRDSALQLPHSGYALRQLPADDMPAWSDAIAELIAAPPDRTAVRALVEQFTWQRVARQLALCYGELHARALASREALRAV